MKTSKDQNPTAPAAMNRRQFAKVMASGVLTAGLAGSASVAAAASAGSHAPKKNTLIFLLNARRRSEPIDGAQIG
jgi:hypothetical protein